MAEPHSFQEQLEKQKQKKYIQTPISGNLRTSEAIKFSGENKFRNEKALERT